HRAPLRNPDRTAGARELHQESTRCVRRVNRLEMFDMNASLVQSLSGLAERLQHGPGAAAIEMGIRRGTRDHGGKIENTPVLVITVQLDSVAIRLEIGHERSLCPSSDGIVESPWPTQLM